MTFCTINNMVLEKKNSCETQLTMLFEDLAKNMSAGKQIDLILLDFLKAFNKVNHSKLLRKLHQHGIRGNALSWIRAFLGDRSQTVVLEGEESRSVPVTSGGTPGISPGAYPVSCICKRPSGRVVVASTLIC